MSESGEDTTEVTESLEDSLTKNWAVLSGQTESTDSAPDTEVGDDTSSVVEAGQEQESTAEPVEDALIPPEKWKDDWKESFNSLPREAQQILLDRHKDVESHLTKETQSLSEVRKRYEKLDDVLKPYDELARKNGIDLTPHVAQALQHYMAFQSNPLDTVKNLINSVGLSQDQLFDDESVDPSIRALTQKVAKLESELAQAKRQPQEQEETQAQRQLDEFKSATNEDGSQKYPHFESLKSLMAPLVRDGKTLEESYKQVLWTLPEYQQEQLKAQEKKAKDELASKRQEKVNKAKKSGSVLPSSDVDKGTGLKPAANWTEALQATLSNMK